MIMSKLVKPKNVEKLISSNTNIEEVQAAADEVIAQIAAAKAAKIEKLLDLIDIDDDKKELIINGDLIIKDNNDKKTVHIQSVGHIKTTKDITVFKTDPGNFAGGNQVVTLNNDGITVTHAGVVNNTDISVDDRLNTLENKISSISNDGDTLKINKNVHIGSDSNNRPYVKISNEGRAGKIELKSKGELYTTLRGYKSEDRTTLVIPNNLQVANKSGNSRFKIINTDSEGNEVNETNNDSDPGTNIKIKIPDTNDLISQIDTIKTDVNNLKNNTTPNTTPVDIRNTDNLISQIDTIRTDVDTLKNNIAPIEYTESDDTLKLSTDNVHIGKDEDLVKIKKNETSGQIELKSQGVKYATIRGNLTENTRELYLPHSLKTGKSIRANDVEVSKNLKLKNWELSGIDNKLNFNYNGETPMEFSAEADTEKHGIFIYKKKVDTV